VEVSDLGEPNQRSAEPAQCRYNDGCKKGTHREAPRHRGGAKDTRGPVYRTDSDSSFKDFPRAIIGEGSYDVQNNNGQTEQSKQVTIIKKRPSAQSLQAITY
jgi:hypothetical protein